MPKTRPPYSPTFRRQMVDLVRAGRDPAELARELALVQITNTSRQSLLRTCSFRLEALRSRLQVQLDLERRDVAV